MSLDRLARRHRAIRCRGMCQLALAGWLGTSLGLSDDLVPGHPTERVASRIPWLETGLEQDHLTGDWGGLRTGLVDRGVHFSLAYAAEVFGNVRGGLKRGATYQGLLEMSLDVDPSKFSAWQGATFHVSSLYPHGSSPSATLVGDISTLSSIDATDAWTLFELWWEQLFWENRASLRLGQLAADEEFSITEYGSLFLNSTFGWPSFSGVNAPAPAYPLGAPGARWRLEPTKTFLIQGGIYDGDPDPGDAQGHPINKHGTRIKLSREEGAFLISELVFRTHPPESPSGLPGSYKLGGWYHTGDFPSQSRDNAGRPLTDPLSTGVPRDEEGNWGIYALADQMLWREPAAKEAEETVQGLGAFLRGAANPKDRNLLEFYLEGGLAYQGLLPGRPEDQAGLALAYQSISEDARETSRAEAGPALDYELVIEGTYALQLKPWWILQPDLQYIIHPGGSDAISDALVIGLRSSVTF